jgi:hypothetical protein
MDFKMSSFFHRPDDIFFDKFRNNFCFLLGQSLDTAFVKRCIPIDIEGNSKDQDEAGDQDDLKE